MISYLQSCYLRGGLAGFGGLAGTLGLLAGCISTGGGGGAPGFNSVTLPFFIDIGGGGSLNLFVFTFNLGNEGEGGVDGAGGDGGVWLNTGAAKNRHPIISIHSLFFINQFLSKLMLQKPYHFLNISLNKVVLAPAGNKKFRKQLLCKP